MLMQNEWEFFFDHHAPHYMDNVFTKNTLEEVEFIIKEVALPAGSHILDVGCGAGRHSVELACKGYKVTGVDISSAMLSEARRNALSVGVKIDLVHGDAAEFIPEKEFDAAICICEGAFGLLGSEDDPYLHDLNILRNINQSLKDDGMLVLTVLNGMLKIRAATQDAIANGTFNPLTLTEIYPIDYEDKGSTKNITVRERGFVPSELVLMLRVAGFSVERIWGGTAGNWKRKAVDLDEMEIMAMARKEINRD